MTLRLLWAEHREEHPDVLGYTQFCTHYREAVRQLDVTMRQVHPAGERMFVDYAGMTLPIVDRATGELHEAQVFVATLGASGYTYAEATWTQDLEDFTGSQVRAFQFFGGVTRVVVFDYVARNIIEQTALRYVAEALEGVDVAAQECRHVGPTRVVR